MKPARKILLIAPENTFGIGFALIPNLGMGYVATAAKAAGFEFDWMDAACERFTPEQVAAKIRAGRYTAVGLNVFTASFGPAKRLLDEVEKLVPLPPVILGGPHPTFEPEETFRAIPQADYLFVGECEEGLAPLLELLAARDSDGAAPAETELAKIPNLAWRIPHPHPVLTDDPPPSRGREETVSRLPLEGGGSSRERTVGVRLNPRSFVTDLNRIPMLPWTEIRPDRYPLAPNGIFSKRNRIAPMIATRGCPYTCTFCGAPNSMGAKIRTRSPENLIEEIRWLQRDFGIHEIHFMDDNFTLDRRFLRTFCETVLRENLKFDWACPNGVRLDSLTPETLPLMEKAGCYSFAVGIESGSQRVLDMIEKKLTKETISEKVNLVRQLTDIRMTGFFVIGLPGETEAEVNETIDFACELPLHRANFFNYSPFPGSPIYNRLKSEGRLTGLDLSNLYIHRVEFASDELGKAKLARLQRKAYLKFYLRPGVLMGLAGEVKSFSQIATIGRRVGLLMGA